MPSMLAEATSLSPSSRQRGSLRTGPSSLVVLPGQRSPSQVSRAYLRPPCSHAPDTTLRLPVQRRGSLVITFEHVLQPKANNNKSPSGRAPPIRARAMASS